MSTAVPTAWWAALLGRLGDQIADPSAVAVLQERLQRHAADLQGQLPELLLRTPEPEASIRSWIAGKDLSHWYPQDWGGTAAQGWQFEDQSINRARGAEPMDGIEMGAAHLDGGLDALLADGVPGAIALEAAEAAVLAVALQLLVLILGNPQRWSAADPHTRSLILRQALGQMGLAALRGGAFSLVISLTLALVPGGQIWLSALAVTSLVKVLPRQSGDPFEVPVQARIASRCAR